MQDVLPRSRDAAAAATISPRRVRIPFRRQLPVIWNSGGKIARAFVILFLAAMTTVLSIAVFMLLDKGLPFEVFFTWGIAVATAGAFQNAFFRPFYPSSVIEEFIRRGWGEPDKAGYYRELATYVRRQGKGGLWPGDVMWTLGDYAIYLGLIAGSVAFASVSLPVLGPWTPYVFAVIAAPVALACWLADWGRTGRLLRAAMQDDSSLRILDPRSVKRRRTP